MKHTFAWRLGIALLPWLALGAVAPALADDPGVLIPKQALAQADGHSIFTHICQGCHMPDAKGAHGAGTYPALAGDPALASARYMALVLINGRRDMPAFGSHGGVSFGRGVTLSDAQIASVTNYVRRHFGNHFSDTLTAADVTALRTGAAGTATK